MTVYEDPDFRRLPPAVAGLFAQAGEGSFFALPAWYDVLARHGLAAGAKTRLYVEGDGVGKAALLCQQLPELGERRRLRSLSSFYSCEHAVLLADTADVDVALRGIVDELRRERPRWEAITLAALDPADPGFPSLARACREAGLAVKPFFDCGTWYEETRGQSFADYLDRRPSVLKNTWRRKSSRLERSGRLRFSYYDSLGGIEQGIADYESIYRESWKKAEPFPQFMPALIRTAAELGAARLGVFHIDGQPAAAQFWIVWRGKACIYKLAHDQRLDDLSLGTVLTMRLVERVLEDDRPWEINFGRGDDPYKKLWLPKRRERWGLAVAVPRTLRGFGLATRQLASRIVRPLRRGEPAPPF
jgi:hypothetical protein